MSRLLCVDITIIPIDETRSAISEICWISNTRSYHAICKNTKPVTNRDLGVIQDNRRIRQHVAIGAISEKTAITILYNESCQCDKIYAYTNEKSEYISNLIMRDVIPMKMPSLAQKILFARLCFNCSSSCYCAMTLVHLLHSEVILKAKLEAVAQRNSIESAKQEIVKDPVTITTPKRIKKTDNKKKVSVISKKKEKPNTEEQPRKRRKNRVVKKVKNPGAIDVFLKKTRKNVESSNNYDHNVDNIINVNNVDKCNYNT